MFISKKKYEKQLRSACQDAYELGFMTGQKEAAQKLVTLSEKAAAKQFEATSYHNELRSLIGDLRNGR